MKPAVKRRRDSDAEILLAQLRWLEDVTGEHLEGEDAAIVDQIEVRMKRSRKRRLSQGEKE